MVRWLVLCFPIGLIMMWSDHCHWRRVTKSAVSLAVVAVLLVLFGMRPPETKSGGVQIVSAEGAADFMGPTLSPDAQQYVAYVPKYIPKNSTIVEPTPSPVPYYVYCNDGGEYYHNKECQYVRPNTPKVTIIQATDHGFKRCKTCNAPSLKQVYGE